MWVAVAFLVSRHVYPGVVNQGTSGTCKSTSTKCFCLYRSAHPLKLYVIQVACSKSLSSGSRAMACILAEHESTSFTVSYLMSEKT